MSMNEMSPADFAALDNNGFGGDGAWWLIVLFLFAMGGWGNGGNGYVGDTQRGFDQAATMGELNSIQASLNAGFGSAEVASCNRAMDAMQTAYNNQIASMNQNFASTIELDNRLDTLAMSLQKCCCDNELATEGLKYTIATEACADRAAVTNGVRDIIANQTAGIQMILDKLCQQDIDALKAQNAALQTQLNMASLAASQTAQTAQLIAELKPAATTA